MAITILGLDHIVLRTKDLPAMMAFYCDALGCHLERELPQLGLTQLRAGSALIDLVAVDSELGRLGGPPPRQQGRNLDHFCLCIETRGEDEIRAHLESAGIVTEAFQERYGARGYGRSLYVADPEGNTVELKLAAVSERT